MKKCKGGFPLRGKRYLANSTEMRKNFFSFQVDIQSASYSTIRSDFTSSFCFSLCTALVFNQSYLSYVKTQLLVEKRILI